MVLRMHRSASRITVRALLPGRGGDSWNGASSGTRARVSLPGHPMGETRRRAPHLRPGAFRALVMPDPSLARVPRARSGCQRRAALGGISKGRVVSHLLLPAGSEPVILSAAGARDLLFGVAGAGTYLPGPAARQAALSLRRASGNDGTRRDQRLPYRIDLEVQAFEGVGAEQRHITRLGEHDELGRPGAAGPYERVADIPVDAASVCHDKALFPLHADAKRLEDIARNPAVLAPRVYQAAGQGPRRPAPLQILDLYRRANESHVIHGNPLLPEH